MREYLSYERQATQIELQRLHETNSILLVEGKSDAHFFSHITIKAKCQIFSVSGKENVIRLIEEFNKKDASGVLAIVDADFTILEETSLITPNLLHTDTHDLETMMIDSPSLAMSLEEFALKDRLAKFLEVGDIDNIHDRLLKTALPIGYLRWISLRENLSLKFSEDEHSNKELDFRKFIDEDTLAINISRFVRVIQTRTQEINKRQGKLSKPFLTDIEIQQKIEQITKENHNPWHVCCGHDLVAILAIGIRKAIGNRSVEPDIIESHLRVGYVTHFSKTRLYVSIKRWEGANSPFIILKPL